MINAQKNDLYVTITDKPIYTMEKYTSGQLQWTNEYYFKVP